MDKEKEKNQNQSTSKTNVEENSEKKEVSLEEKLKELEDK